VLDALVKKLESVIVRLSNDVCKKLTLDKLVQDTNAFELILQTELGIVMEIRFEQFWNAVDPILVTLYIIPYESVIVLGIVIIPLASAFTSTVASLILVV